MLPFLSNKKSGTTSAPVKIEDYDMLDAVVDDFMEAMARRDKSLLKNALEGLCQHIMTMDIEQDQEMFGE